MPRPPENDRWLFGVTLALCLLGAVMIFSASAVTAEHQYGRPYIFLVRQAAWLILGIFGMFALMRTDYRRLREPGVVCTAVCVVLLMLIGTFFLDKSHATHRWIKFGPIGIQPSELAKLAIILYLAWFLDLKRRSAAAMEFRKDDFLHRNDLTMDDIGLIEINEAFAVQVLAFLDHFKIADDDPRVNPWGGAIALGHPLASSGVRLMIQLAREFAAEPAGWTNFR